MSWHHYIGAVEVPLAIPVELSVREFEGREFLRVELTVPCRETGEMIKVATERPVQPQYLLTVAEAADIVRDLVRIALLHEIDEAISINGQRVFNPHERIT